MQKTKKTLKLSTETLRLLDPTTLAIVAGGLDERKAGKTRTCE